MNKLPKRKNTKTSDTTHLVLPLSKNRSWLDFLNNEAVILHPDKDDHRKRLMLTMLTWAEQETSVELADFAFEIKVRREWLYVLSEKYPDFKEVYDYVKQMIGSRRRKGALFRKFDKDVVFKDAHIYDSEYHAVNKYHADLKKDEEKSAHTFNITIEKPKVVSAEELKGEVDDTI